MGAQCIGTKPQEFYKNWFGSHIYRPINESSFNRWTVNGVRISQVCLQSFSKVRAQLTVLYRQFKKPMNRLDPTGYIKIHLFIYPPHHLKFSHNLFPPLILSSLP